MQCFQSESDGPYASVSDGLEGNGGKFVPLMPISVWKQTLWWRNCSGSKWSLRRQCYTSLMSGYSMFIWCNVLTGNVCMLVRVWVDRERAILKSQPDLEPLVLLNHPQMSHMADPEKNLTIPATLLQPNPLFFCILLLSESEYCLEFFFFFFVLSVCISGQISP